MVEVKTEIHQPIQNVWDCFTNPSHIVHWNFASEDWCCPKAENELIIGGTFAYEMKAKDDSFGFVLKGTFQAIEKPAVLQYALEDGRKVIVSFKELEGKTQVVQQFEPETQNPIELQQQGWQAILNTFKNYVENK